jgi:hypothetical protein
VAHLLSTHQPEIWSFLLSFGVIARLWFAAPGSPTAARIEQLGLGVITLAIPATSYFPLLLLAFDTPLIRRAQKVRRR